MVEIHYVNVGLFWIDGVGNVINKSDPSVKLETLRTATTQEHRILERIVGPCSTANSSGFPTIPAFLQAEADDGFAIAYMDQYTVITQKIT